MRQKGTESSFFLFLSLSLFILMKHHWPVYNLNKKWCNDDACFFPPSKWRGEPNQDQDQGTEEKREKGKKEERRGRRKREGEEGREKGKREEFNVFREAMPSSQFHFKTRSSCFEGITLKTEGVNDTQEKKTLAMNDGSSSFWISSLKQIKR